MQDLRGEDDDDDAGGDKERGGKAEGPRGEPESALAALICR